MPAGQGEEERFDAAVEQGTPLGSMSDAEFARELEIVAMLRSPRAAAAYGPDPDVKARAKQRLMAALAQEQATAPAARELTTPLAPITEPAPTDAEVTTRIEPVGDPATEPAAAPAAATTERVLEPAEATGPVRGRRGRHQLPSRPAARGRGGRGPAARSARRRVMLVASAAVVLMVALTGAGVLASRDALPGDGLYPIKRIAESAGLALTFDDAAKARRQLELASLRLDEVERLLARQQSTTTTADPSLVRETFLEFDAATSEGSRMLLGDDAVDEAAELGDLRAWAAEQAARLSDLRSVLPLPVLTDADSSMALLDRLLGRTHALESRSSCSEVTSGQVDDLGPVPAEGNCTPATGMVGGPDQTATTATATPDGSTSTGPGSSATEEPGEGEQTEQPGLLPGRDRLSGGGAGTGDGSVTTSGEPERLESPLPLPLLPPITLPPLLPGMPGVTIG